MLKFYLTRAQVRMKNLVDRRRNDREFELGDLVYVKLQPYCQQTVVGRSCSKLTAKYFGPYVVLGKLVKLPIGCNYQKDQEYTQISMFHN